MINNNKKYCFYTSFLKYYINKKKTSMESDLIMQT